MRGDATEQLTMLTAVTPDTLVPADHPIRAIRVIVDRALQTLSPTFDAMYDRIGRPSIPPEHLLKAMLLQSFYSIRSERQLCERLQYDLLFKWFLGLNIMDGVFDHSLSPRTATGCCSTRWRRSSSRRCGRKRGGAGSSPPTTSRSMARCWTRGRR